MNLDNALTLIFCGIEDGYRAAKQEFTLSMDYLDEEQHERASYDVGQRDLYDKYYNSTLNDEDAQLDHHDDYAYYKEARENLQQALKTTGRDFVVPDIIFGMNPFGQKLFGGGAPQDVYFPRHKLTQLENLAKNNSRVRDALYAYYGSMEGAQGYIDQVNVKYSQDKAKLSKYKETISGNEWAEANKKRQEIEESLRLLGS